MANSGEALLREWLDRWRLEPDGEEIGTPTSRLVPVHYGRSSAMLKVALAEEEVRGAALMTWWRGRGSARVYRHEGPAVLLEMARGHRSLRSIAVSGRDDEASRLLCHVGRSLHDVDPYESPGVLVPLVEWFAELERSASGHRGRLARSHEVAQELLSTQHDVRVLHGDLHHDNVLDFGERGWLAIDPKGLLGERTFDFVNLLRNPDPDSASRPGRFARQATVIARAAGVDRTRLLKWTLAFAGLSASWALAAGDRPTLDAAIAELAASELGMGST